MLTVNLPQLDERRKKRRALPKSAPTFEEKGDDKKGDNGPTFDEEETDKYDRMLREAAEEDDDFSGDAEEMAKVTYETWAARVNAKTERDAVGQRHEDTDFGVGVLDGRYTEEDGMGWANYVPLPPRRGTSPGRMESEDGEPPLSALPQRTLDRHLWHYAQTGDAARVAELLAAGANASSANNESYLPARIAFGVRVADSFQPFRESEAGTYGNVTVSADEEGPEARHAVVCVYCWSAVHWAASQDHTDVVALLAARGADMSAADQSGATALHVTAAAGLGGMVRALVGHGANVSARDLAGNTPLHWACGEGAVDAAAALLEGGADVNATNEDDLTALHWAAERGHTEVCALLLASGADAWLESKSESMDAIGLGERAGHEETCDLLAAHMGLEKVSPEDLNSVERKKLELETMAKLEALAGDLVSLEHTGEPDAPMRVRRGLSAEDRAELREVIERRIVGERDVLERIRKIDQSRAEAVGEVAPGQLWGSNMLDDGADFAKNKAMGR